MTTSQTLQPQLSWAASAGYVETGWSISDETVLMRPSGGIDMTLSFDEAGWYLSGILIGAQGRSKAEPKPRVTIYSDGETEIIPPDSVDISYGMAEGDDTCGCGFPIYRESGHWLHRDAPEMWGDDHDAEPG